MNIKMVKNMFKKQKWMIAIGAIFIILGFTIWLSSFLMLNDAQQTFKTLTRATIDYYRVEGALEWWRATYKTTFPLSLVLISGGAIILTYVLLKREFMQPKC